MVGRGFVDGLIISATQRHDPRIDFLATRHLPFIALGRSLTDAGHAWYDLDFEDVAETAVSRLVGKGHRRIAIGAPLDEVNLGYIFVDSYRKTLAAHGIAFDPDLVLRGSMTEAGGHQMARQILAMKDPPTAVLLANDAASVGLFRGVSDAGLRPGRDIAIIGRDSPQSRLLSPSLTSFHTSLRDLGIALAESLLATMPAFQEIYPQGKVRRLWPQRLVPGESDAFILSGAAAARMA